MQHFFRLPLSVASAAALALASTPIQPVAAQHVVDPSRSKKERNADGTLMNKKDKHGNYEECKGYVNEEFEMCTLRLIEEDQNQQCEQRLCETKKGSNDWVHCFEEVDCRTEVSGRNFGELRFRCKATGQMDYCRKKGDAMGCGRDGWTMWCKK